MKDSPPREQQAHTHAQLAASEAGAASPRVGAETLFREQARFVASFLRHMGTRESDLDDSLQDVFVLAHRKGGYAPGSAGPRTWLASLAIRVVLGRRRARARRPAPAEVTESFPDDTHGPAERLESRRALQRVQAALEHLSIEQRAAFLLYEIEGESCESIAKLWNVPLNTVYSRLHHARKRFLEAYARKAHKTRSS